VRKAPQSVAHEFAVNPSLVVRVAGVDDAAQMARVNVQCWQD
jgi:hypothetical protein